VLHFWKHDWFIWSNSSRASLRRTENHFSVSALSRKLDTLI
jgi:hypothetical protein